MGNIEPNVLMSLLFFHALRINVVLKKEYMYKVYAGIFCSKHILNYFLISSFNFITLPKITVIREENTRCI